MIRVSTLCTAAAIGAAVVVGLLVSAMPRVRPIAGLTFSFALAADAGSPIYYRDPDGKPFYSLIPKRTVDGCDYQPVPHGADVSFEEPEGPSPGTRTATTKPDR